MSNSIVSLHTFMFPFRWDCITKNQSKEDILYTNRTKLSDFDKYFSELNTLKRSKFTIENDHGNYNEYTYFHEFARKALYDTGDVGGNINKNEVVYYDLDGFADDYFEICLIDKSYKLSIDNICIHVFSTGVGILSYNLSNFNYSQPEDILVINEYGRRIYPQFLIDNMSSNGAKDAFLASKIRGKLGSITWEEDFSQYQGLSTDATFLPPNHILAIFGYKGQERIGDPQKNFVFRKADEHVGKVRISKLTDDRMFFLCYYNNESLVNSLGGNDNACEQFKYECDDYWYAFMSGDKNHKDLSIKNAKRQKEYNQNHTYDRWVNTNMIDQSNKLSFVKSSTLFGITRDSFVCIGAWDVLVTHMRTMYYQMAILCFAQRTSVLRFSFEIGLITNLLEQNTNPTQAIKDISKNYIQFVNKIYFREITPQIQGIELYTMFQNAMNIENDVKALDAEIKELHNYISIVEQSNLGKIAMWFLPAGVIVGVLGSNIFDEGGLRFTTDKVDWTSVFWIVTMVLLSLVSVYILEKWLNRKVR